MDCPEVFHLKKHYLESFSWLLHTLPPSEPKTSFAERDETRMQGFPWYRYLKDALKFEFVVEALQAVSHPGLLWQFAQVNHLNPSGTSCIVEIKLSVGKH